MCWKVRQDTNNDNDNQDHDQDRRRSNREAIVSEIDRYYVIIMRLEKNKVKRDETEMGEKQQQHYWKEVNIGNFYQHIIRKTVHPIHEMCDVNAHKC